MKVNRIVLIMVILFAAIIPAPNLPVLANSGDDEGQPANLFYFPVSYVYRAGWAWGGYSESNVGETLQYWNPDTPLGVGIRWAEIDFFYGLRDWTTADAKIGDLPIFLLVLKTTPYWALEKPNDPMCRLPIKAHWDYFVDFAREAALRYDPVYLGIWNEPDIADSPYPQHFGCVEDAALYAEFVTYVYQNIGDIGRTKILAGNVSTMAGDFAVEALENLGTNYDAWGIHCYAACDYWGYSNRCVPEYLSAKFHLDQHNPDAEIVITETAVLNDGCSLDDFQATQIQHYEALQNFPIYKLWFTPGGNGWPIECPSDMFPNPVWYLYMGLPANSIETHR